MSEQSTKPPVWFWIVSVVSLLWNGMGVNAYLAQAYMTAEDLAALPLDRQALYENYPAWATAAFAIAVFGGTIASVLLLVRKKLAHLLFVISLIGVLVQNTHSFFLSDTVAVMGAQAIIFPLLVILIGFGLIFFAKKGIQSRWLT